MTLGYHQFEHLLLTHCTPTLIKRKLGSMFHLDNRYSDVHELVEYYDQILNLQGLRINLFFLMVVIQYMYICLPHSNT